MSLTPSVEITDAFEISEECFEQACLQHADLNLALPDASTAKLSKIHANLHSAAYEAIGAFKLVSHPISFENLGDGTYRIFGIHDIHVDERGKIIASEDAMRLLHFKLKSPVANEAFGYEEFTRRASFLIDVVSRHVDKDALQKSYSRIGKERGYQENVPLYLLIACSCRKILQQALSRKLNIQNSILAAQLLKIIDREKLRIAQTMFNWDTSIDGYNIIVDLWDITHPVTGRQQTLADLARTHLPALIAIGWDKVLLEKSFRSADDLHALIEKFPENLSQRGHGRGLWKMLLAMSKPQLKNLIRSSDEFFAEPKLAAMFVRGNAATLPASSLSPIFLAIKTMAHVPGFKLDRFFHTICKQAHLARKRGRLKEFKNQLPEVVDMLTRSGRQVPDNLSWPRLLQLSNDWHQWISSKDSHKSTSWTWEALLGDRVSLANTSDMTATELLNTAELMQESQTMHHCVGSYDTAAGRGECRIFHLESKTGSKATLEIRNRAGQWAIFQLRSACNAEPTAALQRFASRLVRVANSHGAFPAHAVPNGTNSRVTQDFVDLSNPLSRYPERTHQAVDELNLAA